MTTDHLWEATKEKAQKVVNKPHIVQYAVNQATMHLSVKSNIHYSVTFTTNRHTAKACRYRMDGLNLCVHCRPDQSNELCPQSHKNNREDLRNSLSTSGIPKPNW